MKKLLIIYLFIVNLTFAQDSLVSHNPNLNELVKLAISQNSKLKPLEYEKLVQSTKINQSNKQPVPSIEFMEDFIPFDFKNAGELSLSYSQPLRLFGKNTANEEYKYHLAMIPEIQKEELQKDLTKEIKQNYFMLYQNERKVNINHLEQEILKSITKSIEINYSVGKGNQTDILKSNSELQKLIYEEIDLKSERRIIVNNLSTLTGMVLPSDFKTVNVDSYLVSEPVYKDTVRMVKLLLLNNPEFKMLEHDKLINNLEKNLAELERKPDVTLKTGYKYMSDVQEHFFLISAMIDLPFMPWNSKRIDAMVQEKDLTDKQIDSKYSSVLNYLKSGIRNQVSMLDGQNEKIKFIKEVTIPQLEQTLKSGLIAYQTGAFDYMSVIDSYRMLRENDFKLIEEETKYLLYMNELERIVSHELIKIN